VQTGTDRYDLMPGEICRDRRPDVAEASSSLLLLLLVADKSLMDLPRYLLEGLLLKEESRWTCLDAAPFVLAAATARTSIISPDLHR
jgi:hypothetical protein